MGQRRRSTNPGGGRSTQGPELSWILVTIVAFLFAITLIDSLSSGQWLFSLGLALSGIGAVAYHLYLSGGRTARGLWYGSSAILTVGIVLLIVGAFTG